MRKLKRILAKKGLSLIGTLLVGSLMLTLGFTAAAMTFSHYTLTNVADRQAVARSLAESAANRAIARCLADITYGTKNNIGDDVTVTLDSAPGGWGKVYFGGSDVVAFGNIPRSNNFLAQDIPNQSNGRVVPSRSLHIIAIGQWGKTRRAVETVVSIPKFKYAIAATGQISSTGGLLVAGVKNPAAVENGVSNVPDDQWVPGCMMSNSADATAALDLDSGAANTKITGDVQAVGGIKLGANTVVEGSVKAFNSPEDVPKVEARDYDTAGMAGCNTTIGATEMSLNVVGPARRAGDLTVTGGLNMDAGVLYVDGDVTVHGGLHGKGALISTGKVTINNQSTFEAADDQAAIVAQSDVKISGSNKDNCVYNGVVFTQGNFQANDVTLLGSLCAGKAGGSEVKLNEVNMLSNPVSMDLTYSIEGILPDYVVGARRWWDDGSSAPTGYTQGVAAADRKFFGDPSNILPILQDANSDGKPDAHQDGEGGLSGTRYDAGGNWIRGFQPSSQYLTSVKNVTGKDADLYNLMEGTERFRYNSDFASGYDEAANGGTGGFSLDKFVCNNPLGVYDGNASIKLDEIVFENQAGWEFDGKFSYRDLYKGLRGKQSSSETAQQYKLVNRNTGQTRMVTFAQVFAPEKDPADWGAQVAPQLIELAWKEGHKPLFKYSTDISWLRTRPIPLEPWNDARSPARQTPLPLNQGGVLYGDDAIARWGNSQSSLFKPHINGKFNFNPLQFVQLRDQSQRMLWREYDPGA